MSIQTETKKVVLEGRGAFTLRPDMYVTSGGEGAIYRTGKTIIKLYTDNNKMRRDGMVEKIKLLSVLKHDSIVAPEGIVTLPSGEPIGYFMSFAEGEPMSRVFTNDFRQREGFTDEMAKILAAGMYHTVHYAHQAGAIMVDANELNWLADVKGKRGQPTPKVIDVDSWAIGRYPASVIMPSIRDLHTKGFTELSDWFAWGIVSFQVFTGIHPYKGVLSGYAPTDFAERMKANKSVFTPGVRLNRAVRDFSCIPGALLNWYEATFQNGERTIPPSPLDTRSTARTAARVLRVVTTGTGALVFEKLLEITNDPIVRIWPCGVVLCADGALVDLRMKRNIGHVSSREVEVIKAENGWLVGSVENGILGFSYLSESTGAAQPLSFGLKAQALFRSGNRMFVVGESGITEVLLALLSKPIISTGGTWRALPNSTRWFDGVGVEDALGAAFLVLPFNDKACAIVRVPELDGRKIVSAKAGPRFVVMSAVDRKGEYQRLELTFDREYRSYALVESPVDGPDLNVAILPKGVAASIQNDGEIAIIVPTSGKVVRMSDTYIATDMNLGNWDDRVVYIQNGALFSLRMK